MPRFVETEDRETVDLHAPWWSDKKDDSGRYLERAVVYAEMTEEDDQWVQRRIMANIKGMGSRRAAQNISMKEYARTRTYLFLRMVVELTDERGRPVPLNEQRFARMVRKDAEWLENEIRDRNEAPVEVLEKDEEEADANIERGATDPELTDPEQIAARHFRASRQKSLSGQQA